MRRAFAGTLAAGIVLFAFPGLAQTPDSTATMSASATPNSVPQRDFIDVLRGWIHPDMPSPEVDTKQGGVSWTVLPSLGYNPVYGFAFGASLSGAGRVGTSLKPSALTISGNYSTEGQVQAQVKGDIFAKSDVYLVKLDARYLDTSRSTWGLGEISDDQEEFPMSFKLARYYGTLYRRVLEPTYIGLGFHYDDYMDIVDDRAALGDSTPFSIYNGGSLTRARSSGFSINLLADTRDNLVNPSSGYYLSGSARSYYKALGSDDDWQEFWAEMRVYPHLPGNSPDILAFWFYGWFTFGHAPYLALPSIGWDTYGRGGRGYLQGRIRGANQVYLEAEYRKQLRSDGLLGAVIFLNGVMTTVGVEREFESNDIGAGLGLRIKFNKRSNTNLAIDFGWGEANSSGVFAGLTEVF